jgi:hypothetical protein
MQFLIFQSIMVPPALWTAWLWIWRHCKPSKKSGNTHPVTKCHKPEDTDFQLAESGMNVTWTAICFSTLHSYNHHHHHILFQQCLNKLSILKWWVIPFFVLRLQQPNHNIVTAAKTKAMLLQYPMSSITQHSFSLCQHTNIITVRSQHLRMKLFLQNIFSLNQFNYPSGIFSFTGVSESLCFLDTHLNTTVLNCCDYLW